MRSSAIAVSARTRSRTWVAAAVTVLMYYPGPAGRSAPVAQLDRVSASEQVKVRFESGYLLLVDQGPTDGGFVDRLLGLTRE